MPRLVLPDPPSHDDVVALRGFDSGAGRLLDRLECAHMPDIRFARLRSAAGG